MSTHASTAPVMLRPCPFCGGRALIERRAEKHCNDGIACTGCGIYFSGTIERWNMRHIDDGSLMK